MDVSVLSLEILFSFSPDNQEICLTTIVSLELIYGALGCEEAMILKDSCLDSERTNDTNRSRSLPPPETLL
jgi:hypothetical protein